MGHRTVRDGHLLRKVPTLLFILNFYCLHRAQVNLDDMMEIVSVQKQGEELLQEQFTLSVFSLSVFVL